MYSRIILSALTLYSWTTLAHPLDNAYEQGKRALDAKNYSEADTDFEQAELASPGATNALALRAKALLHLNRFEDAQRCLETYLAAHPQSPDASYLLAYTLFRRGLARESLAAYTKAAQLQRPTADDFKIVGLNYVLLNDNPDAIRWLERAVAEAPLDAEAAYYLGRAYYVQNSFDRAIAAFEKALQLNPHYARAENNLGLAYAGQNRPDLAAAAYRSAIEMERAAHDRDPEPYINLADLLSHGSQPAEALSLLDTAESLAGKTAHTQQIRGQILLSQDHAAEAEAAFRAAIALDPTNGSLHFLLGRALSREGKKDEAEREFAQTKTLLAGAPAPTNAEPPPDPDQLYKSGFLALKAGAYNDAAKLLTQALELQPTLNNAHYALARVYLAQNRAPEAEHEMRVYLAAVPDDATAHYGLGYILAAEQKLDEAKAAFEKSVALQPDQTESLYELGDIALQQDRPDSAHGYFNRVLARDPHHAGALTGNGVIAFRAARYDEACAALEQAVRAAPDYQKAHYYYALALSKLGRKADADREFETVRAVQRHHQAPINMLADPQ